MKIIFKKSTSLEEYHGFHEGGPIDFKNGEKKDITDVKAKELLMDFPDNFDQPVMKEMEKAPKDKMIKKAKTKKL